MISSSSSQNPGGEDAVPSCAQIFVKAVPRTCNVERGVLVMWRTFFKKVSLKSYILDINGVEFVGNFPTKIPMLGDLSTANGLLQR